MKLKVSSLAAMLIAVCVATNWAQAQAPAPKKQDATAGVISDDTIKQLETRVASLKTRLDSSTAEIAAQRKHVEAIETNIQNAAQDTDALIAKFKEMAAEFQSDGAVQKSLVNAQRDIDKYIKEFKGGTAIEQGVAKDLEVSLASMKALDDRREKLLDRALAEIRKLEASKRDIRALIIGKNYKMLAEVLTQMINGFEEVVKEAEGVNQGLNTAASRAKRE